ncbi:hypothetical protein [Vulcanisaeta sp. JCM 16159]|nr:hypothetical protein [Vulcanisaeta sp. JCM 16159]
MESWVKSLIEIMRGSLNANGLPIPMDKPTAVSGQRTLTYPGAVAQ